MHGETAHDPDRPIARFEDALRRHRPAVLAALRRPGSTPDEIYAFARRTGLRLPPLVRRWLGWIDGERASTERLIDNWSPLRLSDIEGAWEVCQQVWVADPLGEHATPGGWCSDWLPLLGNGGGDYLCVDLSVTRDGDASGGMVVFYHDESYRMIGPESFERWLELMTAATVAAPEDPRLPRDVRSRVVLRRDREQAERATEDALAATDSLHFTPCKYEALEPSGLDDTERVLYPQIDDGLSSMLRRAAEHQRRPALGAVSLQASLCELGTAGDGHPIERLMLREADGGPAICLDEYDVPQSMHALGDGCVLVVGYATLWLLRRAATTRGWVPLDRQAIPRDCRGPQIHWLHGGRVAALDGGSASARMLVVAVDGARLRWLGAAALPARPTEDMGGLTIACVGDRLFVAACHGGPGGELYELVGLEDAQFSR